MLTRITDGLNVRLSEGNNAFADAVVELPKYMRSSLEPSFKMLKTAFLKRAEEYSEYFGEQDAVYEGRMRKSGFVHDNMKVPDTKESIIHAFGVYEDILCNSCITPVAELGDRLGSYGMLEGERGLENAKKVIDAVKVYLTKASDDFGKFAESVIKELESADSGVAVSEIFSETCERIRTNMSTNDLDKDVDITKLVNKMKARSLPHRTD
jgi:hypothetical protein